MDRKLQSGLLAALIALSFSCKKNNNAPGNNSDTKKLKYLTQQVTIDSSSSNVSTVNTITYSYDAKKRLSSQNTGANTITYGYADDGRLFSVTNTRSGAITYKKEITYTDNQPSSAVYKTYTGATPTNDTYGFVFNGHNMTELHADGDHGLNVIIYTYDDNNNLTKISVNEGDNVTQYTYDNKKSRFTNMPQDFKNPYISSYTGVFTSSPEASSASNITSQKVNNGAITNYTYTYDSDGYPLTRSTVVGIVTIKDIFTYTEL